MSATQPKIIMFTTPTCSHCKTAKRFLVERKLKFKEIDVSRDQKAAQDMVRKTGQQGVPQLWINNRSVVGFDQTKIERLLNL
ncbi:MAG TPA: NrdH-redoxin [Candidatus Marinimicrobia bacterium]|nr:MAG: NrdH-redoxin [Candidatus Marinimicrobia bacterium CG1_02_48_14]PIZ69321.1 MAG: NrdH-redoxin [Candidatus Marinimicrobia bacterium CG_4_10_14_0_2_um_filter_48_9]PJA54356.1 MAG: NrdH-redoxin [Candidatus Marinimicrobia bacterium CG_4_9_14_3_um_filter_48_9]HCW77124.1 NrdH-redoxin [Candidatus Neomarinimicrobiota bacterium]